MMKPLLISTFSVLLLTLGFGGGYFYRSIPEPVLLVAESGYPYQEDDHPRFAATSSLENHKPIHHPKGWNVHFSPKGGCEAAIVKTIASAKHKIRVAVYVITSKVIVQALIDAKNRGIDVIVIADNKEHNHTYSLVTVLIESGILVLLDRSHAIFHNKYIIIDDCVVVTGSYNFTNSAESRNAENLLIVNDQELAKKYTENWNEHHSHSKPKVMK